jgi:LPXTG-motif cell wall-anchored protein
VFTARQAAAGPTLAARSAGPALARTGGSTSTLLAVAAGFLAAGGMLVLSARRAFRAQPASTSSSRS